MPNESKLTRVMALDCEMVGVAARKQIVARVSLVNERGECVYDKCVKPTQEVTHYRASITGLTERDLEQGVPFDEVQKAVKEMIKDRIVVGHAVCNDFAVLHINHPARDIRDTSEYSPFLIMNGYLKPSLKFLAKLLLGRIIQNGVHSSVEDARAVMDVYQIVAEAWEKNTEPRLLRVYLESIALVTN